MRRALSIIGGVGLGLSLSQFPEYAQQYEQRLGGAVDELRTFVQDFDDTAAKNDLTRDQALRLYSDNDAPFFADRGRDMATTIIRYDRLSAHLEDLQNAGPVSRVADLARYYDSEIGARALENYNPAVPVTGEGFAFAGVGVLGGYGLIAGLLALITRPFRRRRQTRHHSA